MDTQRRKEEPGRNPPDVRIEKLHLGTLKKEKI